MRSEEAVLRKTACVKSSLFSKEFYAIGTQHLRQR